MKKKILALIIFILIFTPLYAQQISTNIKSLLSSEGKIIYGDEPNSIVVMDHPENLERISEFLNIIDVQPQQVLIEARVVEVKLQKEDSMGINWSAFAQKGGLEAGQFKINSSATGAAGALQQNIPFKEVYSMPDQPNTDAVSPFTLTIFDENLSAVLNAMASTFDADILSAPQITTVNNREAEIKVMQSRPWAEPRVEHGDFGITVTWVIHFEEVGIRLKVTPTINEDSKITMVLSPEVSEKVGDLDLTIEGLTYKVPIIDKRTAATKVVIGNSQTLVIGGLIKNKKTENAAKVPWLGDLPVFKHLFKSSKDYTEKTELLIFVSPTIINPDEIIRMARREKYGPGRKIYTDRIRQEKMILTLEKEESEKELLLTGELDALVKRQMQLLEEGRKLEEAVHKEELNLKTLEANKNSLIEKRKAVMKK